ncbi:MAG TPA: Hpt domain-containing protein, partial [Burkholderiales bacterium]|nr:Hpt domain-containing protein [Burkholderiales bacterium]
MSVASPSMMQSLSNVHAAVRDALAAAAQALTAGGDDAIAGAQRHWQSAHAAMQMVNHRALLKFSTELGALLSAAEGDATADRVPAFSAGGVALTEYIGALIAGRRDQPLRLWPAYQALQRARGVAQPVESDLFFPNLSLGPGDRTEVSALSADELRNTRRLLETGLLQWLRKADSAGLQQISDAVTRVEASQRTGNARQLWWIARGVLDALQHDGLAADAPVRRLITQLNLHLGRLLQGSTDTPEPLLREALYLAARAQPVTPLVSEVQQTCGLLGALDIEEAVPEGFSTEAVAEARGKAKGLQHLWSECVAGGAGFAEFEHRARALAGACERLGEAALTSLVMQMADGAHSFALSTILMNDAAALEGACALLMVEQVLESDSPLDAGFAARARNMIDRLKVSVDAPQALGALPAAQLLDEAALQTQSVQQTAVVLAEIERDLRDIELALETWSGNRNNPELIAGLHKPLRQIAGAFSVLGHADAAVMAEQCQADVTRYAQGAHCGEAEGQLLSRRLTVLAAFVDALKLGPADLESVLNRLAITMPLPGAAPAQVVEAPVDGADNTDAEMLDIFLEEAGEVLATISATTLQSRAQPQDQEHLTTLRRAFHTLKGSGRMVGLNNLGEAAWEMEQVMNDLLPKQQPGTPDLYRLVDYAHHCFVRWVDVLRTHKQAAIDATQLCDWAGKLRAGEALPAEPATAPPVIS